MKLSSIYDCHICSVLHENKAANTLRGHLGTEIVNKSETVITVENAGNISKVSAAYCRNIPFDDFYFRINDEALPEYCEPELNPKKEENLRSIFDELLPATVTLSYSDLKSKIMELPKKGKTTAENHIRDAANENIIKKNESGFYYSVNNNKENENESLPF